MLCSRGMRYGVWWWQLPADCFLASAQVFTPANIFESLRARGIRISVILTGNVVKGRSGYPFDRNDRTVDSISY